MNGQEQKIWKVCGMREADNMLRVAALGPDLMGFIFYPKSPRYVGEQFAIPVDFPTSIKRVGVFVNASFGEIGKKVSRYELDYVQLHGDEPVALCAALKEKGVGIIKVFSVGTGFDFKRTLEFEAVSDLFLFDAKGDNRGGNGVPFDWSLLKQYTGNVRFLLSGGLNPSNIAAAQALEVKALYGFDLNSGVEVSPGIKDLESMQKIKLELTSNA